MKKLALSILALMSINTYANNINVIPYDSNGHSGEGLKIKTLFRFDLTNTSNSVQNYLGMEKVIVDGREYKIALPFTLAAHQSKHYEKVEFFDFVPTGNGNYDIKGIFSVAGNPSLASEGHATLVVN